MAEIMADTERTQNIIDGLKDGLKKQADRLNSLVQNGECEVPNDIKELIVTAENMIDLAHKLKQKDKETTFNDPIHHTVKLPPLLVDIIHTPEFDRLRHIKQLGGSYYVFPGASNNRFEHCIGVAYLAGQLLGKIKKDPNIPVRITEVDILCVQVAGLCHDIGHGPFSHAFEEFFLKDLEGQDARVHTASNGEIHEQMSGLILDRIYTNKKAKFDENGLTENHIKIIKSFITGNIPDDPELSKLVEGKEFLYEIVANKFNEIDVDKWDYFTRDCHGLGIQHGFDLWRLLDNASVEKCYNGKLHIVYRDKVKTDLVELFHTRTMVHKRACQHKTIKAAEMMIGDAFILANDDFYPSSEACKLSDAPSEQHLNKYLALTDSVTEQIMVKGKAPDSGSGCHQAAKLLERLITRDMYSLMFDIRTESEEETTDTEKEIKSYVKSLTPEDDRKLIRIYTAKFVDKLKPQKVIVYGKKKEPTCTSLAKMGVKKCPFEGCIRVYYKGKGNEKEKRKSLADAMVQTFPWMQEFRVRKEI